MVDYNLELMSISNIFFCISWLISFGISCFWLHELKEHLEFKRYYVYVWMWLLVLLSCSLSSAFAVYLMNTVAGQFLIKL